MSHLLLKHHGGWRRTPSSPKRHLANITGLAALPEVDPRSAMPPVFNQWALGACTIHADIAAFLYDAHLDGRELKMLSRLWGYWQERKREGDLGQGDTGATGSDGFWVAQHVGLPPEEAWPYTWVGQARDAAPAESVFDPHNPPRLAIEKERYYRLTKPYVMPPLTEHGFKQVLSNRQTISFGFDVYESFESDQVAQTGIVPMPDVGQQRIGGHQVLLVGYLQSHPGYGLVRNSWGEDWGIGGYFLMPWKYILSHSMAGDWTTITRPLGK